MDKNFDPANAVANALPEEFGFYHLGTVRMNPGADTVASHDPDSTCLGFELQGEIRGLILVLFDSGLDQSTYIEMGNVLASRTADQLSRQENRTVLISPPRSLSKEARRRVLESPGAQKVYRRTYIHFFQSIRIPVEVLILPFSLEEIAYA